MTGVTARDVFGHGVTRHREHEEEGRDGEQLRVQKFQEQNKLFFCLQETLRLASWQQWELLKWETRNLDFEK